MYIHLSWMYTCIPQVEATHAYLIKYLELLDSLTIYIYRNLKISVYCYLDIAWLKFGVYFIRVSVCSIRENQSSVSTCT